MVTMSGLEILKLKNFNNYTFYFYTIKRIGLILKKISNPFYLTKEDKFNINEKNKNENDWRRNKFLHW